MRTNSPVLKKIRHRLFNITSASMTAFFKRVIERYIMSNAGHAGKSECDSSGNIVCFADKIDNEIRSQKKEKSNFTEYKTPIEEVAQTYLKMGRGFRLNLNIKEHQEAYDRTVEVYEYLCLTQPETYGLR